MRTQQENNAINRVLKAWGMGSINEPGTVAQMAYLVDDHQHFTTLLKACDPQLRREMYEAMTPHLRFKAKPLEDYIITAKDYAAAAELPTMDSAGNLHPYSIPQVSIEVPQAEVWVVCCRCNKEGFFYADRECDAIHTMRTSGGWAYDETAGGKNHLCPECLDAMD